MGLGEGRSCNPEMGCNILGAEEILGGVLGVNWKADVWTGLKAGQVLVRDV